MSDTAEPASRLGRRAVLLLGLGTLTASCGGRDQSATPTSPTTSPATGSSIATPTTSATPTPTSAATPVALPAVTTWHPSAGDLEPACKTAAARHVEHAGTGTRAVVQVLEAQYGGLLADSASVLVVTRDYRLVGGEVAASGRTYDVRLSRHGRTWRVDEVHPSRPGAPVASLTTTARRVLRSDRIALPPAAEADVRSGQVHDTPLAALLALSRTYRIEISVIRSGHPIDVFGTDRPSDHPVGRAFDTWRIDGHAVVDPRTSRELVEEYMHAAADVGSYNVGGPYLLGSAPQWFSDDTHHDHVHAGFTT